MINYSETTEDTQRIRKVNELIIKLCHCCFFILAMFIVVVDWRQQLPTVCFHVTQWFFFVEFQKNSHQFSRKYLVIITRHSHVKNTRWGSANENGSDFLFLSFLGRCNQHCRRKLEWESEMTNDYLKWRRSQTGNSAFIAVQLKMTVKDISREFVRLLTHWHTYRCPTLCWKNSESIREKR